ncbi:LOW QUALITY PROTEIN: eukaryotic translation initiation factor 2-alpha kinase 3-like [Pecten maximus]|uniref:LOW QUALITY PROTEIN: eukaryotic translation initiation factor 2-alpha kinase 3-like n=1 Tax=Pecten maximus TaxID=6579 RepID=UPI001458C9D8|nr:LOW QUALITY PROTEIN: eukaryotic translation initiation factor 2-alpha kinase 3-like [Pecten maximus]
MGRRRNKRLTTLLTWFVTSVGALCYTFSCIGATDTDPVILDGLADSNNGFTSNNDKEPWSDSSGQTTACPSKLHKESHLMIVSTLDGHVSAIDIKNKGKLVWSVSADTNPLLSSSISKLEISRNGMPTRLIPSLDGGLYQYDGESIEAIPMTVETLLSSSHKLSDKMVMVGSKDIRIYGLNPADGQMNYVCSAEGCQFIAESDVSDMDDILVITRNTRTVRAVDSRTGGEKWNFSVGQHQLQFLGGKSMPPSHTVKDNTDDDEDVSILACGQDDEEEDGEFNIQDTLRIVVPEGVIVGMDPTDSSLVEWQHKFTSPVAGAWFLHKKELIPVNVFDKRLVPALASFHPPGEQLPIEPLLYVGLHRNQLYVQPSTTMKEHVSQAVSKGEVSRLDIPRVAWKPYLNSAPSRTPWLNYRGSGEVPLIDHCQQNLPEMDEEQERGLSVWHENYPFDNGYYLYPEFVIPNSTCEKNTSTPDSAAASMIDGVLSTSLWTYWRQVISISVVTSILVNVVLHKLGRRRNIVLLPQMSSSEDGTTITVEQGAPTQQKVAEEYVSRYKQDFEQMQVLGKGGYGVVFEARNKMDTCSYAVKRIELKSSAKEKVMREVRALATLEHTGIVRFFHAWQESPPPGWQEDMDRHWADSESITLPTPCNSIETESHALDIPDTPVFDLKNPFGGQTKDFKYNLSKNRGSSAEFSVKKSWITSDSESSCSQAFLNINGELENDDSFDVEFKLEDSEDSGSCSKSLPFSKHRKNFCPSSDNNSFSVQFEDSGCAENEKSSKSESSGGIVFTGENSDRNSNNFRLNMPSSCSSQPTASVTDIQQSKNNASDKMSQSKAKQSRELSQKLFLYIQMQLCQRETLKEWLSANNKPRNKKDMLNIFGQIVCAIEYVHGCGLMHRDLKPSNIFFSADNTIKIGDFGLVTALSEEEILGADNLGNTSFKHTTEVGTKLYMGPELVCGKTYGQKVDIFSLGMILFELLYPFSTQMERVRTMTAVKIRQLPKEFDMAYPAEAKYINWLLCEDPCGRPTATEILESPMMKNFCHSPPPPRPRLRTISNDSSGSTGSLGHVRNLSM